MSNYGQTKDIIEDLVSLVLVSKVTLITISDKLMSCWLPQHNNLFLPVRREESYK